MNTNGMAKHYNKLTPEERFLLIVAASDRGDEAERKRLVNASKRITFSSVDYSPFIRALQEMAMVVLLDMLEEAAKRDDAFQRLCDAEMEDYIDGKNDTPTPAKEEGRTTKDQMFDLYQVQGFMLQTKAAGWKLFCERMGFSPFGEWQQLPGFERLKRDLNVVDGSPDRPGAAFTPNEMIRWLNRDRPAEKPEATEADIITAVRFADDLDEAF